MGIAQGFIAFLLDGIAKLLDYLSGIPLIGEKIGKGSAEMQGLAQSVRESGQENRGSGGDLLGPSFDKAATRMRDAFSNIGTALSAGFDKGNSLIDTSDWEQHLGDAVDSVMDRVQIVSQQSLDATQPTKPSGPLLDPEEDTNKGKKSAISAIQRIGGLFRMASRGLRAARPPHHQHEPSYVRRRLRPDRTAQIRLARPRGLRRADLVLGLGGQ